MPEGCGHRTAALFLCSLLDPRETWFERLLLHEYNECYLYYSYTLDEPDERILKIWQNQLDCEIQHLHMAAELLDQYEGRDAESLLPPRFPILTKFESNKDYVRAVLVAQIHLTADGTMYRPVDELPDSAGYFTWQRLVHVDGSAPSQQVVEQHIDRHGHDYRLETEGPHPVEELRARETAKPDCRYRLRPRGGTLGRQRWPRPTGRACVREDKYARHAHSAYFDLAKPIRAATMNCPWVYRRIISADYPDCSAC